MSRLKLATVVLLAFGCALHTYTAAVLASSFHTGFWVWSLSPYLVVAMML
jgi:hypothetical protein